MVDTRLVGLQVPREGCPYVRQASQVPPEFRAQAARLVIETGRLVAHVAAEIGVGEQVLGRWVRLQRQAAAAGDTGRVLDVDERAELERLRRENAELRLDREYLKKVFMVAEGVHPVGCESGGGRVALPHGGVDAGDGVCRA
jgi:transposase